MEITVSARNVDISPVLREAAERKLGRLRRLQAGIDRVIVHFTEEQNPRIAEREICEVMLAGKGRVVRCKVAARDAFAAIDLAVDKLEHQLARLKGKVEARNRGGAHAGDEVFRAATA
ncbi:MAG: ribosome-associated translation inhibitor RaiA [Acidimicrobiia bacterium]